MTGNMLTVRNLQVSYGGIRAVKGVDLETDVVTVEVSGLSPDPVVRSLRQVWQGEAIYVGSDVARWQAERAVVCSLAVTLERR